MQILSFLVACSAAFTALAATVPERRQYNTYRLRVSSSVGPVPPIGGQYLSISNSVVGIYPNQPPIIVTSLPSSTNPDRISLRTLSAVGNDRGLALVGTIGVMDLMEIDLPAVNTPENSWEDFTVEQVGNEEVLRWAAAKTIKTRPWLAMPRMTGSGGFYVWYVDDFQGGFGGVTMPIDNIILEKFTAD